MTKKKKSVPFFDEVIPFRLKKSELKAINKIVKKEKDFEKEPLFENRSHFVRASVIKNIRLYETGLK